VVERADVEQAQLCLAYRTGIAYLDDEAYAAEVLLNGLFGGDARSRLYARVREGLHLAYDAASLLDRQKGVILAHCGIDPANAGRAIEAVEAEVASLRRGDLAPDELEPARKSCIARLEEVEDDPTLRTNFEYARTLAGRQDVGYEELRARLRAVAAADVAAAARRAELDVIYLLLPRPR
jgi:predicted Zn-dependent peptidase